MLASSRDRAMPSLPTFWWWRLCRRARRLKAAFDGFAEGHEIANEVMEPFVALQHLDNGRFFICGFLIRGCWVTDSRLEYLSSALRFLHLVWRSGSTFPVVRSVKLWLELTSRRRRRMWGIVNNDRIRSVSSRRR